MKKKILLSVITLGIIGFIIYVNFTGHVVYNDADVIGNAAGNLLNGGLFCEYDNKIYFANSNDSDKLYSMNSNCTNFKKLTNCSVKQINVAGKYVYYAIVDKKSSSGSDNGQDLFGFTKKGLFRINKNGTNTHTLCHEPVGDVALSGNYIYYQHYDSENGLFLYRVKLDKETGKCILKSAISPASIQNNAIYYAGIDSDHNLYRYDFHTDSKETIAEGNFGYIMLAGDFLYYLDPDNDYSVCRMKTDGSDSEVLVAERVSTFNISKDQKYLYYQIDNAKENRICQMNLDTKKEKTILKGNFNSIHVTSNYIFFKEFDTEQTYIFPVGSNEEASLFQPPVKK